MNDPFQKLQEVSEEPAPFDISKKVLRIIILRRLRTPLFLVGLLLINIIFSCLRIGMHTVECGTLSIIKVIITNFELSWGYLAESWDGLIEILPATEIKILILNMGIVSLLSALAYRAYKLQMNKLFRYKFVHKGRI